MSSDKTTTCITGVNTSGTTTSNTVAFYSSECKECHGCSGKGWIENSNGDIKKCPICEGCGKLKTNKTCDDLTVVPQYPWYPWPVPCDPIYPLRVWCTATTCEKIDGATITHGE